jgi:NADH:ubiquinone oxidoreductase subunit K
VAKLLCSVLWHCLLLALLIVSVNLIGIIAGTYQKRSVVRKPMALRIMVENVAVSVATELRGIDESKGCMRGLFRHVRTR